MSPKDGRITEPALSGDDVRFDKRLRPTDFSEFVGQETLKENLSVFIQAARNREEPLDHCLFYGPPGLGKTTLAHIIATEMHTELVSTSGPVIERPYDLTGILTNLKRGDILFIDEIHRLQHVVEEYLYPAMEQFSVDIARWRHHARRAPDLAAQVALRRGTEAQLLSAGRARADRPAVRRHPRCADHGRRRVGDRQTRARNAAHR
jgi:Holliday junction resolvasome RuvABC ATP-dependent DNA helicase subunit